MAADQGYAVNPKWVGRLMHHIGLEAIYPKPRLRQLAAGHELYPDLLRGITIDRANQVCSADITYLRLQSGCVSLVVDRFSRYVLSWTLSITMGVHFCLEALDQALR